MSLLKKILPVDTRSLRLIVINIITVIVVAGAFLQVHMTFTRVSKMFENQININMKMAVTSFELEKAIIAIEGNLHNLADKFLRDPEGMITGRQEILAKLDDIIYQVKVTENYFNQKEEKQLLEDYRDSLGRRLANEVEISKVIFGLNIMSQRFLAILNEMEIETGKLIVEKVLSGSDATGLHQVNTLLPFCREQILQVMLLVEVAATDLNIDLLIPNPAQQNSNNIKARIEQLLNTLETLTSVNRQIADRANSIISSNTNFLYDVLSLASLVQEKKEYHQESERIRNAVIVTLSRVDRKAVVALQEIGNKAAAEMENVSQGLYLIAVIVFIVALIGGGTAYIIGRQMVVDLAEKEQANTYSANKLTQLKSEIKLRLKAEKGMQEITEKLEQSVEERTKDLAAANHELEAFVYSMSHDLRTPLRGIAGFSNILSDEYGAALDAPGQQYISRIQNSSIAMGKTIDNILDLSRITRSKIVKETVDLSDEARVIIQELQNNHPERDVQTKITPDLTVVAAREQLRSMLESLINNAWKFSAYKNPAIIEFGLADKEDNATFFIKDNGVGFNIAYTEKIFGAFQRLHSEDEFTGSGIGLALAQRVIHRHGGKIWAESKEGEGAVFYFRL